MVSINLNYEGDLIVNATHGPSGVTLKTDAPVDNQGKGSSFSPTDLVATGLGSCMLTIMGIIAKRESLDLTGTRVNVIKEMTQTPPRKIAKLTVTFNIPQTFEPQIQKKLETAALTCPVYHSLNPNIEIPTTFEWGKK